MSTSTHDKSLGFARTFSLATVSTLAWLSITMLPYQVSAIPELLHVDVGAAGWFASIEILVLALTVTYVGRSIEPRDKRLMTLIGIAVSILASLVTLSVTALAIWIASRVAFAVGLGLIAAATNALPAQFSKVERTYATMQVMLSVVFGGLMLELPMMLERHGANGLFLTEVVVLAVLAPLAFFLPRGLGQSAAKVSITSRLPKGCGLGLAATVLMFVGQSILWAFAEKAATASGLDATQTGLVFTCSAVAALAGATSAVFLSERLGLVTPLMMGFFLQFFVAWAMYISGLPVFFVIGALLLQAAQTFTLPYLQAFLARLDASGRAPSLAGAAVNFGCAAGPAVGGIFITSTVLEPLGVLGGCVIAAGLCCVLFAIYRKPAPGMQVA